MAEYNFLEIEKKWQKKWEEDKVFQPKADSRPKFFFTTPYPYISGSLHIGHGRAVTESDVYCRYKRMKGFNVLYPLAFHITGTPVLGISSAIESGNKKKIELYSNYVRKYITDEKEVKKIVDSFKEPWNIVNFFLPKMMHEYNLLGLSIDWSRRFTTGDKDYQKLITWQFHQYKDKNYLIKSGYPVLYCPKCDNAVGEDDIQDADVNPVAKKDFMWIKFKLKDSDLFLIAGTTRPDALLGQTNLWIDPNGNYVIAKIDDEKWVVGKEAFEKIEQQYNKKPKIIDTIQPKELMGKWVKGPLVEYEIPIVPAWFIDSHVGSGIVYSALEDPVDLFEIKKIQSDPNIIKEYNLNPDVIKKLKPISIIAVPDMGDDLGSDIMKEFGVKTEKDKEKLEEAKGELNRRVFRKGVMKNNCGKYAGLSLPKAQEAIKNELMKNKSAMMFYEVSREAFCRDGTKVIVKTLLDQWFLDFNAKGWKKLAYDCLGDMEIKPDRARRLFEDAFEWLDKRPAARRRGIGTQLPFDTNWIIESLSDSTIYMAFYLLKKFINKYEIQPKKLTLNFFNYIFLGKGNAEDSGLSKDVLEEIKKDFDYWYPNDHRHTYQAHLSNHLSFFIFAHAGLFPKKYWPKRISLHGFVLSGGSKMSKSKGNVIGLLDVSNDYGADTFRAYMITSSNIEGKFNWETHDAENMKKNIKKVYALVETMIKTRRKGELGFAGKVFISKFETAIRTADEALHEMNLREYGQIVLYEIPNNLRKLERVGKPEELKEAYNQVIEKYIKALMPLVPHLAEEMWEKLGKKGFISLEQWPETDIKKIDQKAEKEEEALDKTVGDIRNILKLVNGKPKTVYLYTLPNEVDVYKTSKEFLENEIGLDVKVCAVNEKDKYDPENKSKKTKPGKPAIYLE